jgi:hypothetical protein
MSGVIEWALVAAALVAGMVVPRIFARLRPAKPCLVCLEPGRHRVRRSKVTFASMPALCCKHATAYSMSRRAREAAQVEEPPRRRHFSFIATVRGIV